MFIFFFPKVHSYHFSHPYISMSSYAILGKCHGARAVAEDLRFRVHTLWHGTSPLQTLGTTPLSSPLLRPSHFAHQTPTSHLLICTQNQRFHFPSAAVKCPSFRDPIFPLCATHSGFPHADFLAHSLTGIYGVWTLCLAL